MTMPSRPSPGNPCRFWTKPTVSMGASNRLSRIPGEPGHIAPCRCHRPPFQSASNTRCRSRSNFARPNIVRFIRKPDSMPFELAARIEEWRAQLLDTTKRNTRLASPKGPPRWSRTGNFTRQYQDLQLMTSPALFRELFSDAPAGVESPKGSARGRDPDIQDTGLLGLADRRQPDGDKSISRSKLWSCSAATQVYSPPKSRDPRHYLRSARGSKPAASEL
jgi:hypothetical protein